MQRSLASVALGGLFLFTSPFCAAENEAVAADPPIVLSSGVEGGGYWNAGARLQAVFDSRMRQAVEHVPSEGSLDNLHKLLDESSPVNLVFAQADAVQYFLNSGRRDEVHKLELIENIGEECVFIVTGADSALRDDEDLEEADDLRLGIASADSGVAVTFDYMASQMPGLRDIAVRYGDTAPLLDQLNEPGGPVDAVMTVHRPKELSPEVARALSSPDTFRFVQLDADRLEQELWDGRRVYRSMHLGMPGAEKPVSTICVLGVLLGNKEKLTLAQRNRLAELADYHWMEVYVAE